MRILQVVPTYYPAVRYGGPSRSVHGLAKALALRGHEVHVATTSVDGNANLDVPVGRAVEMDGVSVHYFRVPALRRLYWSPDLGRYLRDTIATFDVVHLHSVYLWPPWAAARAAERCGVPYFISPRGMLIAELIRRKSRWIKTVWIELIERHSLEHAAGIHVTAPIEADEIQSLGLPLPNPCCIPNGVEWPDRHLPLSDGPYADLPRPFALFLSRITWKKGLDRLLRAWRSVPDLTLVIAGNDEENYTPSLQAIAREEGISERIRFLGPASDSHKWALYENAEMFVLPSYSENFGNVVAEAMAMGCPVVITEEVVLASLVRQRDAGIVAGGTPLELAQAITVLHSDPTTRLRIGLAGQRAAVECLSWAAVAASM